MCLSYRRLIENVILFSFRDSSDCDCCQLLNPNANNSKDDSLQHISPMYRELQANTTSVPPDRTIPRPISLFTDMTCPFEGSRFSRPSRLLFYRAPSPSGMGLSIPFRVSPVLPSSMEAGCSEQGWYVSLTPLVRSPQFPQQKHKDRDSPSLSGSTFASKSKSCSSMLALFLRHHQSEFRQKRFHFSTPTVIPDHLT